MIRHLVLAHQWHEKNVFQNDNKIVMQIYPSTSQSRPLYDNGGWRRLQRKRVWTIGTWCVGRWGHVCACILEEDSIANHLLPSTVPLRLHLSSTRQNSNQLNDKSSHLQSSAFSFNESRLFHTWSLLVGFGLRKKKPNKKKPYLISIDFNGTLNP